MTGIYKTTNPECVQAVVSGCTAILKLNIIMETKNTVVVYLTDKYGCEMFKEYVHKDYTDSAKRDLQRHLDAAKKDPECYHFLDLQTAEIKIKKIE